MYNTHQNPQKILTEQKVQESSKNGPATSETRAQIEKDSRTQLIKILTMRIEYLKRTNTKVGHQAKIIIPLTHLLKL